MSALLVLISISVWAWLECGDFRAAPGTQQDDVFYDSLAYNLSLDRGFSLNFSDKEWKRVYRESNVEGQHDWILQIGVQGPTTSRAPAWPATLSVLYRSFGRRFDVPRFFNIALLTIALTFLVSVVYRFHGGWVATFALLTISLDFAVLRTAGQLMTESMATAWLAILFSVFAVQLMGRRTESQGASKLRWIALGLGIGIFALIRTNVAIWFCLFSALSVGYFGMQRFRGVDCKPIFKCLGWTAAGVILILTPWCVRNCYVAGSFVPLGSAGEIGVAGYYSDQSYANYGNWDLNAVLAVQETAVAKYDFSKLSLAERERWVGVEGKQAAMAWIQQNPSKLPRLFWGRAANHLGLMSTFHWSVSVANALLLLGAVIGFFCGGEWGRWIGMILFLSVLTTMITTAHHGRFSIPLRPLIHVSCAIGTVWFWKQVFVQVLQPRLAWWKSARSSN